MQITEDPRQDGLSKSNKQTRMLTENTLDSKIFSSSLSQGRLTLK